MLIKCVRNKIKDVIGYPDLYSKLKENVNIPGDQLHISLGKTYVVYAARLTETHPGFFIADDVFIYYPSEYPAPFFDIVDDRLSRYWLLPQKALKWKEISYKFKENLITFKEWVSEKDFFYERLLEGSFRELEIFKEFKDLMELEFWVPSIKNEAAILEDIWVQCPLCDEVWEAIRSDEVLKCPKCRELLKNPISK